MLDESSAWLTSKANGQWAAGSRVVFSAGRVWMFIWLCSYNTTSCNLQWSVEDKFRSHTAWGKKQWTLLYLLPDGSWGRCCLEVSSGLWADISLYTSRSEIEELCIMSCRISTINIIAMECLIRRTTSITSKLLTPPMAVARSHASLTWLEHLLPQEHWRLKYIFLHFNAFWE